MSRRYALSLSLLALASVGAACSGDPRTAPTPVVTQQAAAQLGLALEESDENGGMRNLSERGRSYVDVNSAIRITPRVPPMGAGETQKLATLRTSIETANALVVSARDSLRLLSDQIAMAATEFITSRNAGDTTAAAPRERLKVALARKGGLLQRVKAAANALDRTRYLRILDTAGAETNRQLVELIAQRSRVLLDSIRDEARRVATSERFHVEMSAVRYSPGRTPVQLHLPGYDNLAPGEPVVVDKLSLAASPDEQAELKRTTDAIQALVANTRDLGDVLRNVTAGSLDATRKIVASFDTLGSALRELPTSAEVTELVSSLRLIAPTHVTEFAAAAAAAQAPLGAVLALREAIIAAPQRLRSQPTATAPFELLDTWSRQAVAIVADLEKQKDDVVRAVASLRQAGLIARYDALFANLTPEQRGRVEALQSVVMAHFTRAMTQIAGATQEIGAQVDILRQRADLFMSLFPTQSVTSTGTVAIRELISVRGTEAGITTLELLRADRREGDHVIVSLRIVDAETRQAVGVPAEYTIGVRNFGWYRRWSGGLAFAKPMDPDPPAAGAAASVGFRPGVSASWIAHFRRRPEQKKWTSIFAENGLGLALTSVLFTRDDSMELGFGPTLTLFKDIVQVGGGINLQTEKWYFLLNTPLLELIQRSPSPTQQP